MGMTWDKAKTSLDLAVKRRFIMLLPLGIALAIARTLAFFLAPMSPIAWHLRLFGPMRIGFTRMLAIGYLRSTARMEKYILLYKSDQIKEITRLISVKDEDHLTRARATGRGIILVTIHSMYFRLLMRWVNEADESWQPYLIKAFPGKLGNRHAQAHYLHRIQLKIFGGRLLDTGIGTREAIRILKAGGTVMLTQDLPDRAAETIVFLNKKIPLPLGAARLAEMTNALIVPVAPSWRFGGKLWTLRFWPAIDPAAGETRNRLVEATEEMIRTYPATWELWRLFWRLKREPGGELHADQGPIDIP